MEKLKLSDFKTLKDQLRELVIGDENYLSFLPERWPTVYVTISNIKKQYGLNYATRQYENKLYVWRTE